MPKIGDTRKDKAKELLKRLETGPAYFLDTITTHDNDKAEIEAKKAYQRWVNSWILDDLKYLVPELKSNKQ